MAYNVSNNYKNIIYSEDTRNKIKILFNNVELQDADLYCEKFTVKPRIIPNGAKIFSLCNFVSKEAELILHNVNLATIQNPISISIGTLVGSSYEYVPIGIFNIQDEPTTDKNKTTIKLRDNSIKFDFNYNAKPLIDNNGGTATKLQILQDICTKAGVTCNISSFIGSTDNVGIYDNTITARQYVAYLAEQAGKIATINRSGELIFVDINNLSTWNIPLSLVEKYEIGKSYKIGQVIYEDGIVKYETSSSAYDILYLDASNPYVSSQSQVNSILTQVNTFEIDSVKTGKILGNPAIDGYDLINIYDDKTQGNPSVFKTLATSELIYNGKLLNTFDNQIGEEAREQNTTILGEPTFKKWAKTEINNINGEILIQAGKIDNVEKEINPTNTASGSSIYLEDSTDAELVNFELEGKTTQETSTQGANLFDEDYYRNATYSTDVYKYTLSKITGNSGVLYTKAQLKSGKTKINGLYICLCSKNNPNISGAVYSWFMYNSDLTASTKSINTSGLNELYFSFYPTNISISDIFDTYNFWVSTDNINYEPFVPDMPSPDYPSELKSVGYQNIFTGLIKGIGLNSTTGVETVNTNAGTSDFIEVNFQQNSRYRLSGLTNTIRSYVAAYNSNKQFLGRTGSTTTTQWSLTSISFTSGTPQGTGDIAYLRVTQYVVSGDAGTIDDIDNLTIQLETGNTPHSYIPYGKFGIEVKITGKNLIPFTNQDFTVNNIRYYVNNGSLFLNGTSTGETSSKNANFKNNFKFTLPAGTYTISHKTDIVAVYLYKYNSDSSSFITLGKNATSSSFTLAEETRLYIGFYVYQNSFSNDSVEIMIEKGSSKTTYEQHKSNTYLYTLNQPLRSIGDTKDLLYIKNGMLYVERKIGGVVLDGSETWNFSSNASDWYIANWASNNNAKYPTDNDTLSNTLSDYFKNITRNEMVNAQMGIAIASSKALNIKHPDYITGSTNISNWLSTHNTEVQYILAEPYTEELGEVDIPSTYKTITHINTTDELEPNMNITYVRDTQITNYVEEHIAQIVVNEEGITQRVQTIEDSDYGGRISEVEQKQTATGLTIDIISTNIDKTNGEVRAVTTNTGFTFDENGLNIKKSDTDYNTLIDNTGTYYKDGETIISMTNKDGFLAKDFRLQGQHYYSYNGSNPTHPLASENYDFVDERIEIEVDGQTQYAYATFYNGEV